MFSTFHTSHAATAHIRPQTTDSASRSQPGRPDIMLLPKYFLQPGPHVDPVPGRSVETSEPSEGEED